MTALRRRYLLHQDRHLHYRVGGDGPPTVVLPDAPGSSATCGGLLERLAARLRVYALDAPGHGLSDPVTQPALQSHVDATVAAVDTLGLARFHLVGIGAGAFVAEAVAAVLPERVSALILQHRDGRETAHEPGGLAEVFPAFVPTDDGGHLVAAWHMVRRTYLYDPWFATTAAARRIGDVPAAAVLHQQVMEVLRPTGDYAGLARAAAVAGMPRVDDGEELAARVFDAARTQPIPAADPPPPQPASVPGALRRSYVRTPHGQLHLRSSGRGGTPLLVIHASPGSAAPLEPLIAEFGRHRHVIAPDTLGNGDSDRPARDDTDIGFYADVITAALDALDLPTVDVWGSHTGALIGLELAIRRPDRVRALGMDGITLFDPDEVRDLVAHYLPPLEPDDYGTHLLRAWHMRTDMSLFWPWYRRTAQAANRVALPAAEQLHTWVVDLLVSGPSWRTAYRAAFTYPTRERLPLLTRPALLAAGPHDPLAVYTDQAATLSAHLETATSAGTRDSDALRQTVALYEGFFSRRADRR